MEKNMEKMLSEYLTKHNPAKVLFDELKGLGNVYLIGGVLREVRDNGGIQSLRDIDIVLDTIKEKEYREVLKMYAPTLNRFGGYKVVFKDLIIDIWLLRQTWAYSADIIKCNIEDYSKMLPQTVFLNMDSIVYDMKNKKWYDEEYIKAMETKVLDVVLEKNPFVELNIVRSFVIKKKYKMDFSDKLKALIKDYAYDCDKKGDDVVLKLYEAQNMRYKKEILTKMEFEKILEKDVFL